MTTDNYTLESGGLRRDQPKENGHSKLIENIYSFLNSELLQLFTDLLDKTDGSLTEKLKTIELAISADSNYQSNEQQELELKALEFLRRERVRVNTNFFIAINENLLPSFTSSFEGDSDEEELSLVDIDEMEEMVAITTMHANALNLFGEEINYLEARIEYLEIMAAPIFGHQALNPNRICEAFQTAIKPFGIRAETK